MSTIFGHGRLRLYLLKLLDENPRHGYEIISLLRDRFLGVYSPSPGTIYPRLARLEEEGLVTHTEEGGRKVYSLTDKGRQELRERESDLNDLEREITDSVRDIARAVKQDVRATISSLREELKFSSGGARRSGAGETGPSETASEKAEEGTGKRSEEDSEEPRDRGCEEGSRWAREWERFAQGFGAFGSAWGRGGSERSAQAPEFERALHDFGDRVRDVFREAGHVGEAAAGDLRRILDETIEVIRRDMRHWGPASDDGRERSEEDGPGTGEPRTDEPATDGTGGGETGTDEEKAGTGEKGTASDGDPTEKPKARPMPPSSDPWGEAVADTDGDEK